MARSADIKGKCSLKQAKMGKNCSKIQNFACFLRIFFYQAGLLSALFSCFQGFAYLCPAPLVWGVTFIFCQKSACSGELCCIISCDPLRVDKQMSPFWKQYIHGFRMHQIEFIPGSPPLPNSVKTDVDIPISGIQTLYGLQKTGHDAKLCLRKVDQ